MQKVNNKHKIIWEHKYPYVLLVSGDREIDENKIKTVIKRYDPDRKVMKVRHGLYILPKISYLVREKIYYDINIDNQSIYSSQKEEGWRWYGKCILNERVLVLCGNKMYNQNNIVYKEYKAALEETERIIGAENVGNV